MLPQEQHQLGCLTQRLPDSKGGACQASVLSALQPCTQLQCLDYMCCVAPSDICMLEAYHTHSRARRANPTAVLQCLAPGREADRLVASAVLDLEQQLLQRLSAGEHVAVPVLLQETLGCRLHQMPDGLGSQVCRCAAPRSSKLKHLGVSCTHACKTALGCVCS